MYCYSVIIVGGVLILVDLIMLGKVLNGCYLGGGLYYV